MTVLPFDAPALTMYETLGRTHRSLGSQDLKIAAIALTRGAVLVTPNIADFENIADLHVEHWMATRAGEP